VGAVGGGDVDVLIKRVMAILECLGAMATVRGMEVPERSFLFAIARRHYSKSGSGMVSVVKYLTTYWALAELHRKGILFHDSISGNSTQSVTYLAG
jgi:hypothetical protein